MPLTEYDKNKAEKYKLEIQVILDAFSMRGQSLDGDDSIAAIFESACGRACLIFLISRGRSIADFSSTSSSQPLVV